MRTVGRYLRPYRLRMTLQMIVKLTSTVVELLLPGLLSRILDEFAPAGDRRGVWLMGALMLLCAAAAWVGNMTANRMATGISRDFIIRLRQDLFDKTTSLSATQRDRVTGASLNSRLTSDTYNVHNMVDRMQRLGIRAPILLIGGILVSFALDARLTLVLIATLPFLTAVIVVSSRRGVPLYSAAQQSQDRMVRKVQEFMPGALVIKALSRTRREQEAFGEINDELTARQRKAEYTMAAVSPVTNFVLNTGLAIVVLVGAYLVARGPLLPGTIIAFLSYFTLILNALLMISRIFVMLSRGTASARRIEEVLSLPAEAAETAAPAESARPEEHFSFRHVTFSYGGQTPALRDVTFSVPRGGTLGIIGPTGSGKSTLLSLLLRQYDVQEGDILFKGRPIGSIPREEVHRGVGVVFQNDFLMADSIRENIRFCRGLDDEALWSAADRAQAGFIREKPGGLDHPLEVRGRNLSGGQQQRVVAARALAGVPELLLLDDCSSALDYRTDRALRRAIRVLPGGITTVIVSQRVSSVMAADQILYMDSGAVAARGTHAELLRTCPAYRELCELQLGGDAA